MQNKMAFDVFPIQLLGSQSKELNEERDHLELINIIARDLNTIAHK